MIPWRKTDASVVGVDLSGRTTGRTALAVIEPTGPRKRIRVISADRIRREGGDSPDEHLVELIGGLDPVRVGIDAPLTLPLYLSRGRFPGRPDRDEVCRYDRRLCDEFIGGMSTMMLGVLTARGIFLSREIEKRSLDAIEVYPAKSLERFGVPPSWIRGADGYKRDPSRIPAILDRLGLEHSFEMTGDPLTGDHELDAVICALTVAAPPGAFEFVGDPEEGQVMLPLFKFWGIDRIVQPEEARDSTNS